MQIINKVFVVTGAGNGIGREVALQILAKGKVAAIDIDQAGLKTTLELAQDNLENISIHQADLTDLDQIEKLKEQIIQIHQVIDGLINGQESFNRLFRSTKSIIAKSTRL